MSRLYIPYSGNSPVTFNCKGHKLILVSQTETGAKKVLELVGASFIEELEVPEQEIEVSSGEELSEETESLLASIAQKTSSGVVIIPSEIETELFIGEVKAHLPWVH